MSDYTEVVTRSKIKRTKDYYVIKIDKEDYEWISKIAVYVSYKNFNKYKTVYYKDINPDGTLSIDAYNLPRRILGIKNNENRNLIIKYKNEDFLDLRKENLELVMVSDYLLGRKKVKNKTLSITKKGDSSE